MSPYMRAYERGIKLAQYKWLSKYANPGQGLSLEKDFMPSDGSYTLDSRPMTNLRADYDFGEAPPEVPRPSDGGYGTISDAEIPYEDAPTTVGAGDNYRDLYDQLRADAVMRGDASPEDFEGLDYMDMRDAMGARMLRPGDTFDQNAALDRLQNMGEFREGLRQDFGNVATSENIPVLDSRGRYAGRRMLTQTQQGRNPMTVSPIASDELFYQDLAKDLGETPPAAATSSPLTAPVAPAATPAAATPAAPVAPAATPAAEPEPFNFNVGRGGYGRQFRALQDQFGKADRGDELEGFTYRDMAQAMGNRGLRVDDRFDANALLQRMRNMQDQPKAMEGTQFNVQRMQGRGKNRGYQNVGNFQNLSQQRATAQRRMQAQAPANVNPFGGLRGAGPQRPAPAPKPTSTPKKPAMPKFVGPGNIDSIMGK